MDDSFWTAFGAIGTTIGSLITSIVALLAYKQYKLSKTTKLKINIKKESIIRSHKNISEEFIKLEFLNCGIIDLYVVGIAVKINNKYFKIENFFKNELNEEKTIFPVKVTKECIVSVKLSTGVLRHLKEEVFKLDSKQEEKLCFVITDGKGKEHKKHIFC